MNQITHPDLKNIRIRRQNLDITQQKLAELCGVSQSLITKIEAGKVDSTYTNTKKILDVIERLEKEEEKTAKDILNRNIIFADKKDKVKDIISIMQKKNISQLPVRDGDNIIGQITENTILKMIMSGNSIENIADTKIEKIMSDALPRVSEDTPFSILSILLQHNQGILITKKGKVIGIITKIDLLKGIQKK